MMKAMLRKIVAAYRRVDRAYKRGFNVLLISCESMTGLSSRACDEELPLGTRIRRRIHLCICTWCRRYEKQLRFLRRHARHYAEHSPSDDSGELPADARERIRARIGPR